MVNPQSLQVVRRGQTRLPGADHHTGVDQDSQWVWSSSSVKSK